MPPFKFSRFNGVPLLFPPPAPLSRRDSLVARFGAHGATTINSDIRPADPERTLDRPAMRSESAGLQSPLLPAAEQAPSAAGPSDGPAAQRRLDVDDMLRLDEFSDATQLSTLRTRFLRQVAAPGGKNAFKACRKLRRAVVRQLSREKAMRAPVVGKPQLDDAREHVRFFLPKTSSGELLSLRCSELEFSKHFGTGVSLYMRFQKVTGYIPAYTHDCTVLADSSHGDSHVGSVSPAATRTCTYSPSPSPSGAALPADAELVRS